ncbi:bacillithiol biosynthesis deacetylase BshB1 [Paracrocinitomix mangrovi]|uniref:bacillithiol biosynthesis deacetylase BshB1 n=1 Tax=Paracrocinitomix mangrovi TaxID=2862509 RepID=UPI001C8EF2E4|nr:bacillithiol biosynthesis deacetylase BshB1 [Paracrocinitomix mangrovi]UKN01663.1 bacillithiol biosynthesis deacetylase BshB1 [Paracrocinitomix mangrovi]
MKLDILAIAAHPDDAELGVSGTLIKAKKSGKKVGILDLTRGELGTRGTAELRDQEASDASDLMNLDFRVNLGMADGFFENVRQNQMLIIEQLRKFQPDVVFINAPHDRHPDHGKAAALAKDACFLSGLPKIKTALNDVKQEAWRPRAVYHYIQDYYIKPDVVVDISDVVEAKIEAIKAYKTQFYDPESKEPLTPISGEEFFDVLKGRWRDFGRYIGAEFAEGFVFTRPAGVKDITDLI